MPRRARFGFLSRLPQAALPDGVSSASEFERAFLGECARVERSGRQFCVVVYSSAAAAEGARQTLAHILLDRIRLCDVVGDLDSNRIAVLLPETSGKGGWSFADDVLERLARKGLSFRCDVFEYPFGATGTPHPERKHSSVPAAGATGNAQRSPGDTNGSANVSDHAFGPDEPSWNGVSPSAQTSDLSHFLRHPADAPALRFRASRRKRVRVVGSSSTGFGAPTVTLRRSLESRSSTNTVLQRGQLFDRLATTATMAVDEQSAKASLARLREQAGPRPIGDLAPLLVVPLPWWKRSMDIAACAVLLPLLSPIFLLAALAVKFTSEGSTLFRQQRAGRGGKPFWIYKFRSMYIDAETRRKELEAKNEASGPVFKIRVDPRITPVGRFIRKTSIDELPQLWNVLKGEMTLVGPRPPMLSEIEQYERWQRGRLNLTGGITCIWQVSGRSEIGFVDWVRMDLRYARSRSFLVDVKLLLRTVGAVVSRRGAY